MSYASDVTQEAAEQRDRADQDGCWERASAHWRERAEVAEARVAGLEKWAERVLTLAPFVFEDPIRYTPRNHLHRALADYPERSEARRTRYAASARDPNSGVCRGVPGRVTVGDMAGDGTGPWRLFVGEHGVAMWPGKAAAEDPRAYAHEVARCVQRALEDGQHGPVAPYRWCRRCHDPAPLVARPPEAGPEWVPGMCPSCECRPAGWCRGCVEEDREAASLADPMTTRVQTALALLRDAIDGIRCPDGARMPSLTRALDVIQGALDDGQHEATLRTVEDCARVVESMTAHTDDERALRFYTAAHVRSRGSKDQRPDPGPPRGDGAR